MSTRTAKGDRARREDTEAYASLPVPPVPADLPVRYQEGGPVEYEASPNRSYAAKLRAKEASASARAALSTKEAVGRKSPLGEGHSDSASKLLAASYWLFSPGDPKGQKAMDMPRSTEKRSSPFRHSPDHEKLLNVVSSRPRTSHKYDTSSPDQRRTPLQDVERVVFLEKKLQESNERCRTIEKQYHDLLAKQVETERLIERDEDARLETHTAEETVNDPTLASDASVESLLRLVLEELKELKTRMTHIEAATSKLDKTPNFIVDL